MLNERYFLTYTYFDEIRIKAALRGDTWIFFPQSTYFDKIRNKVALRGDTLVVRKLFLYKIGVLLQTKKMCSIIDWILL